MLTSSGWKNLEFFKINKLFYLSSILNGEPQQIEHDELRWITKQQMAALSWAPADIPLLQQVQGDSLS